LFNFNQANAILKNISGDVLNSFLNSMVKKSEIRLNKKEGMSSGKAIPFKPFSVNKISC
jgi:hypothetical protein